VDFIGNVDIFDNNNSSTIFIAPEVEKKYISFLYYYF
jgi:hypothetical protein